MELERKLLVVSSELRWHIIWKEEWFEGIHVGNRLMVILLDKAVLM